MLYRVIAEWILGIELHWSLDVGPRLRIFHGYGLVVNPASRIGADCVLRHTTTLGLKETADQEPGGAPVLGDRVDVGPHVVILGPVRIGDGAVIGAGAVVTRDVAPGAVVAGNPARELERT
ncbi:MAG: serine acetyltransferase [Planctomycetota bacterium]|nr:serine acetyltransferase [Planctomycetota bacterium]